VNYCSTYEEEHNRKVANFEEFVREREREKELEKQP
jgi:hypothetical protein